MNVSSPEDMMKKTTLSCEDLWRLIPHRYPFFDD